jgi:TRAP-type C4-dicarboxylate transport system permease small subunit
MVGRLFDALERVLNGVAVVCLAVLAVTLCIQVTLRYVFHFAPVWGEEFCRILLVWVVMAGAAVSVRTNQHIRVEFLTDLLPIGLQRAWHVVRDLATLLFFCVVVGSGIEAVGFNHAVRTVALQWPMSYLIAALPIGFAAAALFLVRRMVSSDEAQRSQT